MNLYLILCSLLLSTTVLLFVLVKDQIRFSPRNIILGGIASTLVLTGIESLFIRDGFWSYHNLSGIAVIGVPIERIFHLALISLFTVFLFETFTARLRKRALVGSTKTLLIILCAVVGASLLIPPYKYVAKLMLLIGLVLAISLVARKVTLRSPNLWIIVDISLLIITFFDLILVNTGTVLYKPSGLLGLHLLDRPIENYLYLQIQGIISLILYIELSSTKERKKEGFHLPDDFIGTRKRT
jgi:lycopene cyclase domain-containing protein